MIPIGTPAQQVRPKHRCSADDIDVDTRDYPDHVCPGQHCLGRRKALTGHVLHGHRHTDHPVHTLTPAQAAAATEFSGRVR